MIIKWIGVMLIISGSGAIGLFMASKHQKEINNMRLMIRSLNHMSCELQYRLTPLPDLCRSAANEITGPIKSVLLDLATELDHQIFPDVSACMESVLYDKSYLPELTLQCLRQLGASLGKFDLEGQLLGIDAVRTVCKGHMDMLEKNKEIRIRNYQTLSLCAGAALAIILV